MNFLESDIAKTRCRTIAVIDCADRFHFGGFDYVEATDSEIFIHDRFDWEPRGWHDQGNQNTGNLNDGVISPSSSTSPVILAITSSTCGICTSSSLNRIVCPDWSFTATSFPVCHRHLFRDTRSSIARTVPPDARQNYNLYKFFKSIIYKHLQLRQFSDQELHAFDCSRG